jgi:DNA invertase Pin-like site-specific DNA recombinase
MGGFKITPKEIREQILSRIKNDGVSATKAAAEAGISVKTVYNWLRKGVVADSSTLENIKLKKENQSLYELVGRLSLQLQLRGKK